MNPSRWLVNRHPRQMDNSLSSQQAPSTNQYTTSPAFPSSLIVATDVINTQCSTNRGMARLSCLVTQRNSLLGTVLNVDNEIPASLASTYSIKPHNHLQMWTVTRAMSAPQNVLNRSTDVTMTSSVTRAECTQFVASYLCVPNLFS